MPLSRPGDAMKKRSRTGGEPIKGRRPKTPEPKHPDAAKAGASANSSLSGNETEVARLRRELNEALEQQKATTDVLRVISSSPGQLEPVFRAMLEDAVRILEAKFGTLFLCEGNLVRPVAGVRLPPKLREFQAQRGAFVPPPGLPLARLIETKKVVHMLDDPERLSPATRLGGARSHVAVPMLKEGKVVGAIYIYRQEVKPFTDKQIELVSNFAAQAVIAIENARLLNELRQRTADLTEALEQQTATSEVLRVISSSLNELDPVFQTMLTNATRLCGADFGQLLIYLGDGDFRNVAMYNAPPAFAEFREREPTVRASGFLRRTLHNEQPFLHIADCTEDPAYRQGDADFVKFVDLCGVRTLLGVPLLKDKELIGVIGIYRQAVRPFTDKQIELVTNFAAQAVIAIENARLLNELRQRTDDLTEALEQQTGTSELLQVISSSSGDLEPVFATMLENAVSICDATFGNIYRVEGDGLCIVATHHTPAVFAEARRTTPYFSPGPKNPVRRMMTTKSVVHVDDVAATEAYADREPAAVASVELGGTRTLMIVPMLKENELVGACMLARQEVRPFNNKQMELVTNFAAQAVIAIENARLLNELRQRTTDLTERTADLTEALEQQTATSEVLQVISSSPGDLQPVFATMLEKAVRLCDATFGNIYRWDGEQSNILASHNTPPALVEARKRLGIRFVPKDLVGQAIANKKAVHIADLAEHQDYIERSSPGAVEAVEHGGVRTHVVVPMLKDDELIGTFHLSRQEVRPFTDKQIELVTNFAAQAVIAIENTRLLKELRERTEEVEKLNQHLEHRVADQVGEIERMSRLRRFLPPQVADLIVASGSEKQLESHRREITALFCDLRGFTGFTESADAEDVMALLRDYHAAIGELVIRYSGTLERYAGDGVMVVFNDPVPVENPALQAVLMALELRNALGALTQTWSRLGHDIGFGIGIAHGFATLGTIGYEGRFDYAAIGTVSNVASRLCDEAKPGQILISPRVLTKVENAVKVEPVGEFELKGIRRPLAAYNVVGAVRVEGDQAAPGGVQCGRCPIVTDLSKCAAWPRCSL